MSILKTTDPNKLINLLRGEVGEIIQCWIVLNIYDFKARELMSDSIEEDMSNRNLVLLNVVRHKFREDLIARLAELSSTKHGRLNFHYAADKFKSHKSEVERYKIYLTKNNVIYRRNNNIAHKAMSPSWSTIDPEPVISKCVLLRSVSWAISIMKLFDKTFYGDNYRNIWQAEREIRYAFSLRVSVLYMLLPYRARTNSYDDDIKL